MATFSFHLDQYAEAVRAPMTARFDAVEAIDWCETDEVAGNYSYRSVWDADVRTDTAQWEFRFTDPHAAFDFKLRWC